MRHPADLQRAGRGSRGVPTQAAGVAHGREGLPEAAVFFPLAFQGELKREPDSEDPTITQPYTRDPSTGFGFVVSLGDRTRPHLTNKNSEG